MTLEPVLTSVDVAGGYISWLLSVCGSFISTMAQLQCYQSIKDRKRIPSSAAIESQLQEAELCLPSRPRQRKDTKLYDVEVIEEDGARVKVHYIGYGSELDEWKPREEVTLKPQDIMHTDFHPLTELACQIKKSLLPSKHEDPTVRIQVPGSREAFEQLASVGTKKAKNRYTINAFNDLTTLLGDKWFLRIANKVGDFSYVILSTVEYHLTTPRRILEYEPTSHEDGTVTFEPVYIEQCCSITFKFVRGDGNRQKLAEFL